MTTIKGKMTKEEKTFCKGKEKLIMRFHEHGVLVYELSFLLYSK